MGTRSGHSIPRWGDRRAIRLGLLGGSFNPAHAGHAHIAREALKRLRLDQIWLIWMFGWPVRGRWQPPWILAGAA